MKLYTRESKLLTHVITRIPSDLNLNDVHQIHLDKNEQYKIFYNSNCVNELYEKIKTLEKELSFFRSLDDMSIIR